MTARTRSTLESIALVATALTVFAVPCWAMFLALGRATFVA
jgi:hypothetical protein